MLVEIQIKLIISSSKQLRFCSDRIVNQINLTCFTVSLCLGFNHLVHCFNKNKIHEQSIGRSRSYFTIHTQFRMYIFLRISTPGTGFLHNAYCSAFDLEKNSRPESGFVIIFPFKYHSALYTLTMFGSSLVW